MPTELEAKVAVTNLAGVRDTLVAHSAARLGRRFELNIYFDSPDRALLARDAGLRVRSMRPLDTAASDAPSCVITYKGPQAVGSALKSREEIELDVADAESASELLERLGYLPQLGFEKHRESWSLSECIVELDELPRLGTFVEVEGPSREAVMAVLASIGLDREPLITESYISMVSRAVESSRDRSILRFS